MKQHDRRSAFGISELYLAPALPHVLEPNDPRRANRLPPRDDRKARAHAAISIEAMIGGSQAFGSGASSK